MTSPRDRAATAALREWQDFRTRHLTFKGALLDVVPPLSEAQQWQVARLAEDAYAPDPDRQARRLKGADGGN